MTIYVDADACPKAIKAILCKAAKRTHCALVFVANQALSLPRYPSIKAVQVGQGFDVADQYIVDQVQAFDLVITADIPLADQVMAKKAQALNPRGELYTQASIKQRLAMRDLMDGLRSSGIHTGGPNSISARDVQQFANALDRYLGQYA